MLITHLSNKLSAFAEGDGTTLVMFHALSLPGDSGSGVPIWGSFPGSGVK